MGFPIKKFTSCVSLRSRRTLNMKIRSLKGQRFISTFFSKKCFQRQMIYKDSYRDNQSIEI